MPVPTLEYPVQQLNNTDGTIVVPSGLVDSMMVVCLGTHQGNISSISYGAQSLTQIASGSSAFDENGDIWVLLNPTAGSATLDITRSGGSWHGATVYILAGAKQSLTIVNNKIDSASGSSSTCSIVPPDTNCLIIGSAGGEATYTGSNSPVGMIPAPTLTSSSFENSISGYKPSKGGQPQTFSFGMSSGQRYGMAMVAIEGSEVTTGTPQSLGRRVRAGGMSVTEFAR